MSPETISAYSDRPIRPLPKIPLRERLSPHVAESIKYPPAPKTTIPLFYYGYNVPGLRPNSVTEAQHSTERESADEIERTYIARRNKEELESDDDEQAYHSRVYSRPFPDPAGWSYRFVQKQNSKLPNPHPPVSTASSVDGYDSFENTNNKKKRKIPTAGDSNLNGAHLASDVVGIGTSGADDSVEDVISPEGAYQSSVGAVPGISGPGRGRYGRMRNGRSPLRTLSDATSNWGNGRTKQRQSHWPHTNETTGIISESIATANAEKFPMKSSRGQENISVLQQEASKISSPATNQFTFTFDSQVPATIPWPGSPPSTSMHQSPAARISTHATQTNPHAPPTLPTPDTFNQAKHGVVASHKPSNAQKQPSTQSAPPKKTRRRLAAKEYLIAARQRREQQKWRNDHHPIPREDQWTCEFCEYEQIFGTPPVALIKQYEIKDRQARKQEAEKRRLLEKAKMKGRKGKKGHKAIPKAAPAIQQPQQTYHSPSLNQSQSQGTQSEEYYEDEYDDEYAKDDPISPSPDGTPHAHPVNPLLPDPGIGLGFGGAGTSNVEGYRECQSSGNF